MPLSSVSSFLSQQCCLDRLTPRGRTALLSVGLPLTLLVLLPQRALIGLLAQTSFVVLLGAGLFPRRARQSWRKVTPLAMTLLAAGLTSMVGCGQSAATGPVAVTPPVQQSSGLPDTPPAAPAPQPLAAPAPQPTPAPAVPVPTPEQSRQRFGNALKDVFTTLSTPTTKTPQPTCVNTEKAAQP